MNFCLKKEIINLPLTRFELATVSLEERNATIAPQGYAFLKTEQKKIFFTSFIRIRRKKSKSTRKINCSYLELRFCL